jgi:hypothetical protein
MDLHKNARSCPQITQITQIKTRTFEMSSASICVICGKTNRVHQQTDRS